MMARAWGLDTPSEPKSSEEDKEDEEEGELTLPPHSLLHEALPQASGDHGRHTSVITDPDKD
jgi:hypothetical protein